MSRVGQVQSCRVPGCDVIRQGFKVARFHSCKGPGCRVPRFQGSKVPGLHGSKMFQDSKVAFFLTLPAQELGNYCVYIGNCISNFLMCNHFAPFKRNRNAALSGHIIWPKFGEKHVQEFVAFTLGGTSEG